MKSAFINDGYTRDGYIAETDHFPPCRFTYRPCTITERVAIRDKIAKEIASRGAAAGEKAANEWIASRIQKWDLTDQGGHAVKATGDNCGRLAPKFSARLFEILIGDGLSDPDPETGAEPVDEEEARKNL